MFSIISKVNLRYSQLLGVLCGLVLRLELNAPNLKVNGVPTIILSGKGRLKCGRGITFNSNRYSYHGNMPNNLKIWSEGRDALIEIGDFTRLNGCCIHARSHILIGKRCLIASNVNIIDSNGHAASFRNVEERINTSGKSQSIIVEDDVWIAMGAIILPGTKIGKGSIVSANSVVKGEFPPFSIIYGNPCTFKTFDSK